MTQHQAWFILTGILWLIAIGIGTGSIMVGVRHLVLSAFGHWNADWAFGCLLFGAGVVMLIVMWAFSLPTGPSNRTVDPTPIYVIITATPEGGKQ